MSGCPKFFMSTQTTPGVDARRGFFDAGEVLVEGLHADVAHLERVLHHEAVDDRPSGGSRSPARRSRSRRSSPCRPCRPPPPPGPRRWRRPRWWRRWRPGPGGRSSCPWPCPWTSCGPRRRRRSRAAVMPGNSSLMASTNPPTRSRVSMVAAMWPMTPTLPLPASSSPIFWPASLPAAKLSVAMKETRKSGLFRSTSKVATTIPALVAFSASGTRASESQGASRMASTFLAMEFSNMSDLDVHFGLDRRPEERHLHAPAPSRPSPCPASPSASTRAGTPC